MGGLFTYPTELDPLSLATWTKTLMCSSSVEPQAVQHVGIGAEGDPRLTMFDSSHGGKGHPRSLGNNRHGEAARLAFARGLE